MKSSFVAVAAVLSAASIVSAQTETLAQLVTTYGTTPSGNITAMSRVAALVAANPAWAAAGSNTLFAAVDSGYASLSSSIPGNTGVLFLSGTAIDWTLNATERYQVIRDASNDPIAIFHNYGTGAIADVHVRTGTEDVTVINSVRASNGILYVLTAPLNKLSPVSTVLSGTFGAGRTAFRDAIVRAGLQSTIDNLAGCTFLVPNDTVWNAASAQISGLTTQQLAYVIFNHIIPTVAYSNGLLGSLNTFIGTSLPVALGPGGVGLTVGGGLVTNPSDITSKNGPIHPFGAVLIPSPLPANPTLPTIPAGNQLTVSTTTVAATAAATARTTALSTATASPTSAAQRVAPATTQPAGPFIAITVFALLATFFSL